MPADPRNPRTLILDTSTPHQLEASRVGQMIYLHTNGRPLTPAESYTLGMDEEMATQISDALNAILSQVYDRVITRNLYESEQGRTKKIDYPTEHPAPAKPQLEDL